MENEKIASYFLLLEDNYLDQPAKVHFCKFVKVLEFCVLKREKNPTQLRVNELRNIAKMVEQIDGGLKPTKNIYKAKIDLSGELTDLRSGKSIRIPKSKLASITSQFLEKKSFSTKTASLLPRINVTPGLKSSVIPKKSVKFPSLNRINRRIKYS